MSMTGVIVNGRVEFDVAGRIPDGTEVRLSWGDEPFDDLPEPEETYEQWLQSLRDAYEDSKAGKGTDAREVLKQMALRRGLPLEPGE